MADNNGSGHSRDEEVFRSGSILNDRYALIEQLGTGASAITWRARDRRLERDVAIKILRHSYATDPTFAQRFDREARTAASVSHGNVVDVYDVGHDGETLYLVMQYVAGEDLKHLVERNGALEPTRARDIVLQILAGLQAIHATGIIHRDIKPQNVLIGRDGVAKVTDFGVAQVAVDVGLTTIGTTVGTAAYMAPEQARAETLSEATDLYAVGVVFYELLTGGLPFSGPTNMAMMLAHIQQEPPRPSQHGAPTVEFDGVVLQAMAKSPQDRFRTAQAMTRALTSPSMATGQRTQAVTTAIPVASRQTGTRASRSGAWPTPPTASIPTRSATQQPVQASGVGSGVRVALWGFLFLIVLVLCAIGVYAYNEYLTDDPSDDPPSPGATRTVTSDPTDEPPGYGADGDDEEDESPPTIGPSDTEEPDDEPTEEPEPTDEPTDEPVETTDEPEPTGEPTDESPPIESSDPTEEPVIIEPEGSVESPAA